MATDFCEGAFLPKFAKKRLKMTEVLRPVKVSELMLKLLKEILCLMYFQKINVWFGGLAKF